MPQETPVTPITNKDRMEALEQQKVQLESSFQRVAGAIELLQAIMDSERIQAIEDNKNAKKKK
jgi:hypothetical protein